MLATAHRSCPAPCPRTDNTAPGNPLLKPRELPHLSATAAVTPTGAELAARIVLDGAWAWEKAQAPNGIRPAGSRREQRRQGNRATRVGVVAKAIVGTAGVRRW